MRSEEEIRTNLKTYKLLTKKDFHCLECGYKGVMGRQTKINGFWGYLAIVIGIMMGLLFVFAKPTDLLNQIFVLIGVGVWIQIGLNLVVDCPSCSSKMTFSFAGYGKRKN